MFVYEEECVAAGLDPKKVASIARRLDRAAKDATALGLTVFGGSGSGSLRCSGSALGYQAGVHCGPLIVADLDGSWDGGDGGFGPGPDGLQRGEGN